MNKVISKGQRESLEARIKVKKEDDKKSLTVHETILDMYLPIKNGIRANGYTVPQIAERLGDPTNHKFLTTVRTIVCNLSSELIKDGIPFGGIKDGRLKKYGFPVEKEFDELTFTRRKRMVQEIRAGQKYLEEGDPLQKICDSLTREANKQLKLFYAE